MMEKQNRLATAASAYLRAAQDQPVFWREWSAAALEQAQREDKPVLLAIGAVWCQWCEVMDRESYRDADTAALINQEFVAIRVDRDEHPEVDARYQAAVAAISGQGGWPLTAFLTPEGEPFSGGTYFPAEDRVGRAGFRRVLHSIAEAFHRQRTQVDESASSIVQAVSEGEAFTEPGELHGDLGDRIVSSILSQFDPRNGGFGSQPKFPQAASLEVLIDVAARGRAEAASAAQAVRLTLGRMAAGGIQDHLAGGFHRYSLDDGWVVPRFEKMASENSELLGVFCHAFETFAEPHLAQVAAGTLRWMDAELSDREHGGFYASQNADTATGGPGDYFTWTRGEAEAVLTPEEMAVAERRLHLRAVGHMHHDPARNVLSLVGSVDAIAAQLRLSPDEVSHRLEGALNKLLAARLQRQAPFVDRTLYSGVNGLCISAYLAAGRALKRADATAFALRSLRRVLDAAWRPGEGLGHIVSYGLDPEKTPEVPGVLDDYVFVSLAALDAWEHTGDHTWFEAARQLATHLLEHFYDAEAGGFFDTAHESALMRPGLLSIARKPVQDAPSPAGNAGAARLLLRLHTLTGEALLHDRAAATLRLFAGMVEHLGLYVAGYAQALRLFFAPGLQVCILGEDDTAEEMASAAAMPFLLNKSVIRLKGDQLSQLPPMLAEALPPLVSGHRESVAVVQQAGQWSNAVSTAEELKALLTNPLRSDRVTVAAGRALGLVR